MVGGAGSGLVAIIDDDESVRSALMGLMRASGISSRAFPSAEEYLGSDAPAITACVVTDVRMPGMSGLELQARLAACSSELPVIFITAHGDAEARRRALSAGAHAFFQKPFGDDELIESIRSAMDEGSTNHTEDS
jgi:FixJ family two-component response regulator